MSTNEKLQQAIDLLESMKEPEEVRRPSRDFLLKDKKSGRDAYLAEVSLDTVVLVCINENGRPNAFRSHIPGQYVTYFMDNVFTAEEWERLVYLVFNVHVTAVSIEGDENV